MKKLSYSIDEWDKDGDLFDRCVLIHCKEGNLILRFDTLNDVKGFNSEIAAIIKDIEENGYVN